MPLSLDAVLVLDAIDRKGSFAAAAEELHRVPSAITYAVQKLEEDLGIALFDRRGYRAQLNPAGRELLGEGRRLLDAADEVEKRVKRIASGCEVELRVAVDDVIPLSRLFSVFEEFYGEAYGTRLRVLSEVYGGAWDALVSNRADLVIGAPGEGPAGGGYSTRLLGTVHWEFMVAPQHPLAGAAEPIAPEEIVKYRSIAAADSSRTLAPRTTGLLTGQEVLTLSDMRGKLEAQRAGLGIGYLPRHIARQEAQAGRLVAKRVLEAKADTTLYIAWRTGDTGKSLAWFVRRLNDPVLLDALLA